MQNGRAHGVAVAAGRLVAVPLGALARRRRTKPMHVRGAVFEAVLEPVTGPSPWGVQWPTEPLPAVVRFSRGAGLPRALPDLLGLAVHVPPAGSPAVTGVDLLLSTAGTGRLGRRVPRPRRNSASPHSSIMAYRGASGTVRVAALPEAAAPPADPAGGRGRPPSYVLAAAPGGAPWRPFARLRVTGPQRPGDPDLRFDAVRHPPPGLVADGPLARFRAPSYARAQAARTEGRPAGGR